MIDDYVDEFKPDKVELIYSSTRGEEYTLTKDQAEEVCKAEGETLCPKAVVEKQKLCNYGWTSDTDSPGFLGLGEEECGEKDVWSTRSDGLGKAHCCKNCTGRGSR